MKRCAWTSTGVLVSALSVVFPPSPVEAGPSTSPSARQAARLKHNPPRGWIRHYLPDDRYKILGGTWKYVSTELDRFYYPAWAPEMLRRSPNRVIGFNSAQDAEEAGYMPASGYAGVNPGFDRQLATQGTSVSNARINRGRVPIRIRLSDGVSSVLLPPGWERVQLGATTERMPNGQAVDQNDMLRPVGRRSSYVVLGIQTLPRGTNAEAQMAEISSLITLLGSAVRQGVNNSGIINNRVSNAAQNLRTSRVRWAGLSGMQMTMRGMPVTAGSQTLTLDRLIIAARGNKFYMVGTRGNGGGPASRTVISSFQPR